MKLGIFLYKAILTVLNHSSRFVYPKSLFHFWIAIHVPSQMTRTYRENVQTPVLYYKKDEI
jgi:hypothetical protein